MDSGAAVNAISARPALSALPPAPAPVPLRQQAAIWCLFLVSGACALIYEVLWCRQLGLVFGNTVQSLSAVLTAFMGGLALGSFTAGRICHRLRRPLLIYGLLELLIGLYCALLPWAFSGQGPLTPLYRALYGEIGGNGLPATRFAVSFILMLIPTTFMGATLPILSHYLVRSQRMLGRTVGTLYAVNTLGAVVGAAATGFALLPLLGKQNTNNVAVACNLALGLCAIAIGWRTVFQPAPPPHENAPPVPEAPEALEPPVALASEPPLAAPLSQPIPQPLPQPISPSAVRFAILTFGVTGFAAMATQIGWTRALSLGTGSSTYAFSLIVSVLILGLSAGGWWASRIAPRAADTLKTLAYVLLAIGLLGMALAALLGVAPLLFFFLLAWGSDPRGGEMSWGFLLAIQAAGIAVLIFIPTFLMGATMPLTLQVASAGSPHTGQAGKTVGNIYAINTVGSILGSFLGGLVVLPLLEIQSTLQAMALLYALPGFILLMKSPSWRQMKTQWAAGVLGIAVLAGCFAPRWQPRIMSAGLYLLRDRAAVIAAREGRLADAIPNVGRTILFYREGAAATVAVAKVDTTISLSVGGKPDASTGGDMSTQIGLALLPALLHPHPEQVLVIGLGSGVSTGAALARDTVRHVDVVEMSPEVVAASSWFAKWNHLAYDHPETPQARLNTPRVTALINDGRNHLLLSSRKYDLIASEPSNPWMAGVGNLFTRESFQLARQRLKPGGIMCQWIHSYSLNAGHVYSIIRTFGEVFPHIQLWWINTGDDYLLIGSDEPLRISVRDLRARLAQPAVHEWLASVRLDSEYEFLADFIQHDASLKRHAAGSPLHTDDNMLLEFSAPREMYNSGKTFDTAKLPPLTDEIVDLKGLSLAEKSEFMRRLDLAVQAREHLTLGWSSHPDPEHLRRAVALDSYGYWIDRYRQDELAAALRKDAARAWNGIPPLAPAHALQFMNAAIATVKDPRWSAYLFVRAREEIAAGHGERALFYLARIDDPALRVVVEVERAKALKAQKNFDAALALVETVLRGGANPLPCKELAAEILLDAGHSGDALALLQPLLEGGGLRSAAGNGWRREALPFWRMLGEAKLRLHDYAGAELAAKAAYGIEPHDPDTLGLVARLFTGKKQLAPAVDVARRRWVFDPENFAAAADFVQCLLRLAAAPPAGDPRTPYENFCAARRLSREMADWKPDEKAGWEGLARAATGLAACDRANAELWKFEARQACQRLLKLCGNDASKLPPPLRDFVDKLP